MGLLKDNIHIDIHIDNLVINFPCEKPEDEEALKQEIMEKLNNAIADIKSTIQ
jgi:DNA-binding protein YbaB